MSNNMLWYNINKYQSETGKTKKEKERKNNGK